MPEFQPPIDIDDRFDKFTQGYLSALFWVGIDNDEESPSWSAESGTGLTVADIDPASLLEIISECRDFQTAQEKDLTEFDAITGRDLESAGHDFHLTRNGHGAGFWDHGAGDVGDRLSKAAKVYGGHGLYLGDDGKLYNHG